MKQFDTTFTRRMLDAIAVAMVTVGARSHSQRSPPNVHGSRASGRPVVMSIFACWLVLSVNAQAAEFRMSVMGQQGAAVDAVVSLHSPQAATMARPAPAVIDQRDRQFVPLVTVVNVGSRIQFPNSDNIRHQVYSFSPAKTFQLPLYSGKPSDPVLFDKPGIVELGCNIHDWMLAYVLVEDTPFHAISDGAGKVVIADVPPGAYLLRVWHPDLGPGVAPYEEHIVVADGAAPRSVTLKLVPNAAPAAPADDKLRQLQEKFRALRNGK